MALPSAIFFALCLTFLAAAVLLLQRRYLPLHSTPEYLLVATFLPLFISSSIVVLVPIDLSSSSSTDDGSRGIVLPQRLLLVAWRISYWLCFVLTWAILPILQSYSDSGHRSSEKRILQSLRENARYHLIVLSVGTIGLVYFFISSGVHIYTLKSLVFALSYFYALALAIYLMGHGLVAIPRTLLRDASLSARLRRLQKKAPGAYDKLLDATKNLEEVEQEVAALNLRKSGSAREFQEWIDELAEMTQLPESALAPSGRANNGRAGRSSVPNIITEEYLATLTRRLKLCVHRRARFSSEWQNLVQAAADAQAILDSSTSKRLTFTKHFGSPTLLEKVSVLNPYTRHILYLRVLPHLRRVLAFLLAICSVIIVWSELVHKAAPQLSIISYTVVHHPSSTYSQIGFAGQVIAAAWIAYMCACAYFSLSVVKVWGSYALVKRMTSGSSACFYGSYAARLTVPLAFNFVMLLPPAIREKTVFYNFMGKLIDFTPLGEGFSGFFPMVILLPVAATLFNLYGRVKDTLGFGTGISEDEDESDPFGGGGWREGRDLIDRELNGNSVGGFIARSRSPILDTTPQRSRYRDDANASDGIEEEEEENAWSEFTHRVKNTFETFEAPRWMRDLEERRPRWMGGSNN